MQRETLFVSPCRGWFNQQAEQVLALENGRDLGKSQKMGHSESNMVAIEQVEEYH